MKEKDKKILIIVLVAAFLFIVVAIPVGLLILNMILNPAKSKDADIIYLADVKEVSSPHLTTSYSELDEDMRTGRIKEKDYEKYDYYIFYLSYYKESERNVVVTSHRLKNNNLTVNVEYKVKCGTNKTSVNDAFAFRIPKGSYVNQIYFNYKELTGKLCDNQVEKKPVIYVYPKKEQEVTIKLLNDKDIITSYPKYNNGWKVLAKPNGDLIYNGRLYYSLFWEGKNHKAEEKDYGFVVKGENTAEFLEDKLTLLGLTEREANEFIVFWLPQMEKNKYNYIRFETKEEIDSYMPISIIPEPDTIIRVYMQFKALYNYKEVKEQVLTKTLRKGYTVVEWGGSQID